MVKCEESLCLSPGSMIFVWKDPLYDDDFMIGVVIVYHIMSDCIGYSPLESLLPCLLLMIDLKYY